MRRIPELLAPVGGPAQLYAAVNNGADAVYLGGARFNARAKADNFAGDKLCRAIEYAHERNVKVYVTFNTLLKDSELEDALVYGARLSEIGADAVIVQDMGLSSLLRKYVPDLPLHLSTQGTVYNPQAAGLMKELGMQRIVPARELSLEEIRAFTAECHAPDEAGRTCEVEVFVHGALCMCYSGQCQMSRLLGASGGANGGKPSVRSGNRGLCAQPCRLPYTDDRGRTSYFLSPKDLCLLEEIPALCEAGVDSFKIEGRLKSPEYVAVTTSVYRKYLDQYAREGRIAVEPEDLSKLRQIYCRGSFTKGYLYGNPGEKLLSGSSPKHTGIYIGKVRSVVRADSREARGAARKGAVLVDLDLTGTLNEGDGVEIRPAGGRADSASNRSAGGRADSSNGRTAGGVVTYLQKLRSGIRIGDMKGDISSGDRVYKVTDRELLREAAESFAAGGPEANASAPDISALDRRLTRKIPLKMRFTAEAGKPAQLVIQENKTGDGGLSDNKTGDGGLSGVKVSCTSEEAMEYARKRPADPERIRAQLSKLGGTPFEAEEDAVQVEIEPGLMVPVAEINRMRREGIGLLLEEKRKTGRPPADRNLLEEACSHIAGRSLGIPQPEEVTGDLGEPVSLEAFLQGADGVPVLPEITKGELDAYIKENFDQIAGRVQERGIIVNNAGWIRQFQKAGVKVYGGHGLNVYNEEARLLYEELGVEIVEASYEADRPLQGRIPLMVTEHPVKSKTLTDRKGQVHMVERSPQGDKTLIW